MNNSYLNILFNSFDKLVLLFGTPFFLLVLTFNNQFEFSEKVSLSLIFSLIIIGIELLNRSLNTSKKFIFKRKKKAINDINIEYSAFLTPQIIITSVLAFCLGGIIGFYYISHTLFSILTIVCIFFILILGLEFIIQDLFFKQSKRFSYKKIINSISTSSILNTANMRYLIYCILGIILTYNFYSNDLFSVIFGTTCIVVTGYGIDLFKKTK